ncbi:MAG TPA: hypothetical protein PKE45_12365 [Caldilineaceae bacterium]|nr:hypothetical protein [Caldilineaceae bacterium]
MTTREDLAKEGLHLVDVRNSRLRIDLNNLLPILFNAVISGVEAGENVDAAVATVTYGGYPMIVRVEVDKDGMS